MYSILLYNHQRKRVAHQYVSIPNDVQLERHAFQDRCLFKQHITSKNVGYDLCYFSTAALQKLVKKSLSRTVNKNLHETSSYALYHETHTNELLVYVGVAKCIQLINVFRFQVPITMLNKSQISNQEKNNKVPNLFPLTLMLVKRHPKARTTINTFTYHFHHFPARSPTKRQPYPSVFATPSSSKPQDHHLSLAGSTVDHHLSSVPTARFGEPTPGG